MSFLPLRIGLCEGLAARMKKNENPKDESQVSGLGNCMMSCLWHTRFCTGCWGYRGKQICCLALSHGEEKKGCQRRVDATTNSVCMSAEMRQRGGNTGVGWGIEEARKGAPLKLGGKGWNPRVLSYWSLFS